MDYRYFKPDEFERCTPKCSISEMDRAFMFRLDEARAFAGIPFVLTSAYRSPEYDSKHGRSGKGYHTRGRAVDIKCLDGASRRLIVKALLQAGFAGIGIADRFIHVDDRPFSLGAVWLYDNHTRNK